MNKHLNIIAVTLLCLSLLTGCKHTNERSQSKPDEDETLSASVMETKTSIVLPVADYLEWVRNPENGLRKEKEIDELGFQLQYKPYEYIICLEERVNEIPDTLLQKKLAELEGVQYYDLKISLKEGEGEILKFNISSADQYNKRVKYFAFEMQNDIQLVEGNDTLPCLLYHFERTYDVAPSCTILLGFNYDKTKAGKQKTLLVYDRTFNKGLLKFTFKENKFLNLPKLQTI